MPIKSVPQDKPPHTMQKSQPAGYDFIGDVHGCAHTLEKLLVKLDYQLIEGRYRCPGRQAIFLGDIVDRGPRVREALHLVKNMVDAGDALCLMGNHEYNAIGYTTAIQTEHGTEYLREHNLPHNRLIAETLTQFASFPEEWRMFLDWFKTLPLFLELPGCRAVHACWDEALIEAFKDKYKTNIATAELLERSAHRECFEGRVMDRLTRGTSMRLPEGMVIRGLDGYRRTSFRTKFWSHEPQTYRDVVFQPDPLPEEIADQKISDSDCHRLLSYRPDQPPIFFGHYWLQGRPKPIKPNVACLDYSAVKYGKLVAYRFDGEQMLDDDKFVWVYVDPDHQEK